MNVQTHHPDDILKLQQRMSHERHAEQRDRYRAVGRATHPINLANIAT